MRQLIFIVICGAAVVLVIAFSANAWFGMSHGHPTAYATWLHDIVARDPGAVVLAALAVLFLLTSWIWNPDKNDPRGCGDDEPLTLIHRIRSGRERRTLGLARWGKPDN